MAKRRTRAIKTDDPRQHWWTAKRGRTPGQPPTTGQGRDWTLPMEDVIVRPGFESLIEGHPDFVGPPTPEKLRRRKT